VRDKQFANNRKGEKMRTTTLILAVILAVASASPLNAQIDSGETALKMTHELLINALKSGNLTTLGAVFHPRALGFYWQSQSVVQLRSEYTATDALPAILDDLSRFAAFNTDTVYRVAGNTGLVCMTATLTPKQGDKKLTRYLRATWVYINVDGNWKLISWHSSEVPLTKK
jgi:hypothetical protein